MLQLIPKVYAQISIEKNFLLPGETKAVSSLFSTLGVLSSLLLKNAFVIAGVIFFALVVFGGLTYMLNAGSGDKEGMEKGKNALTYAVLGFVVIFVSYWIVVILEQITGVNILNSKF